ncbi:hypothetical protein [Enhygromyxa salina]|nr:hypothetical protein [Enhygromyxa salina]
MHAHRLVVQRLPEGSVPPVGDGIRRVDPPALGSVRLVFGVGSGPDADPSSDDFHPVYTIAMPVFSHGGLDPDGIYEFDAGAQLELLRARATRRRWAVRLELELEIASEAVNAAELWVETPWTTGDPRPLLLGPERGTPLSGGGRSLTIASTPVTTVDAARTLGGTFTVVLRDADPHGGGPATVESPPLEICLDLRCYEFEPEADDSE